MWRSLLSGRRSQLENSEKCECQLNKKNLVTSSECTLCKFQCVIWENPLVKMCTLGIKGSVQYLCTLMEEFAILRSLHLLMKHQFSED